MRTKKHTTHSVVVIACALGAAVTLSAQRRDTPEVPSPSASGLNGYSIVFVVGDTETAGKSDAVPPAAQKALNDMQAFLPYKHYQLLDSAWMLCCTAFGETVSARINGPLGHEYQYAIRTNPADSGRFNVHFSLTEVRPSAGRGVPGREGISDTARAEYSRQLYEATKDRDDARVALDQAKARRDVGLSQQSEVQAAQVRIQTAEENIRKLQATLALNGAPGSTPDTSIMDNSFYIAPGETVVIGTSRLNTGQALIALLTAVPKSSRKELPLNGTFIRRPS